MLLLIGLLWACQSDPATSEQKTDSTPQPDPLLEASTATESPTLGSTNNHWIVNIDKFRLRQQPGTEGSVLTELSEGSQVTYLGESSDFQSQIKLRGTLFDEPWVKVETADGQQGWVFAGGIHPRKDNHSPLANRLLRARLSQLFGEKLTQEIDAYRKAYEQMADSEQLASTYRQGLSLRKELTTKLDIRAQDMAVETVNLFWLDQAIPGYVTQLVAEGTTYYLFNDYKEWLQKAKSTSGEEDDAFVALCLETFAQDSVEHFFPAWYLQTWDYGGHSLLGQGVHQKVLDRMEAAWLVGAFFHPEIKDLKQMWLEDIVGPEHESDSGYWEGQAKILKELDQIIQGEQSVLTSEDRVALEVRRKMFAQPKANKILINQRSGE